MGVMHLWFCSSVDLQLLLGCYIHWSLRCAVDQVPPPLLAWTTIDKSIACANHFARCICLAMGTPSRRPKRLSTCKGNSSTMLRSPSLIPNRRSTTQWFTRRRHRPSAIAWSSAGLRPKNTTPRRLVASPSNNGLFYLLWFSPQNLTSSRFSLCVQLRFAIVKVADSDFCASLL